MEKAILLRAEISENGEVPVEVIDFDTGGDNLRFFYKHCECELVDIVHAYGLQGVPFLRDICLVVDDEGLMTDKAANPLASLLYGYLEHGQPLVGNVLVCKDIHTPDGVETGGLTDAEIGILEIELMKLVKRHNEKVTESGCEG